MQRPTTSIAGFGHVQTTGEVKCTLWAPIEGRVGEFVEY